MYAIRSYYDALDAGAIAQEPAVAEPCSDGVEGVGHLLSVWDTGTVLGRMVGMRASISSSSGSYNFV